MRVLHAFKIYRPEVEGGVPEVIGLLTGSAAPNVENCILVARRFGHGRNLAVDGVPVKAVTSLGNIFSMPIAPAFPFALARAARSTDVVVLHAPFPLNDVGVMFGIPARVGLVIHWHSEIFGRRFLVRLVAPFIRNTLARADRIIVSNSSIISISPFLKEHVERCIVVPFGVDPDYWAYLGQGEQAEVERLRAAHRRLIVATGRLVRYKGFDVLVRALRQVDATAIIVGDGPQATSLRRLGEQLGVGARLILAGSIPRHELKLLLHAAQVFAFPSVTSAETFGIAQLEAMAVGVPVVNTALPTGVPLVARHEREALTVVPNDPSALAAAINRLLDDPALAAELGRAGRLRVNEEFHQHAFIRRVKAVYEEVHSNRSRAAALPSHQE
jgi:glycosyltransferase involved in cell wall biosynthesis